MVYCTAEFAFVMRVLSGISTRYEYITSLLWPCLSIASATWLLRKFIKSNSNQCSRLLSGRYSQIENHRFAGCMDRYTVKYCGICSSRVLQRRIPTYTAAYVLGPYFLRFPIYERLHDDVRIQFNQFHGDGIIEKHSACCVVCTLWCKKGKQRTFSRDG